MKMTYKVVESMCKDVKKSAQGKMEGQKKQRNARKPHS